MYLNGPVITDELGQVLRGGLGRGERGDDVDGLALDLPGPGIPSPAGELDGLVEVREVDAQAVDVDGLQGAGLDPAVPDLVRAGSGRDLGPGQGLDLGVQQRLVLLDHRDVLRLFGGDQPVQVGAHGQQGVEGDRDAGQVQFGQHLGEVRGLVVLDVDLQVVQQSAGAVLDHAEQVDPGAVRAAGAAGGLPVHRHSTDP